MFKNRNDLPTYMVSTLKVLNISVLNKVASLSEAVKLINIHVYHEKFSFYIITF